MKIKIKILLLFIGITLNGYSQNFVPNGSFEEKTDCPYTCCQLDMVNEWYSPLENYPNSPDYYNKCSNYNNSFTNSIPRTGDGHLGFGLYSKVFVYTEYIAIKLIKPLTPDNAYNISFWIKLANLSNYAVSDISLLFANSAKIDNFPYSLSGLSPQISNKNGVISDTLWVKINVQYKPDDSFNYLIIGSFKDSSEINYLQTNYSTYPEAYYFVDDFSIYESSLVPHLADAGPNQISCLGDSIQLGTREEPDYMYYWEGNDGTRYTGGKPWVKPLKTTTYTLYQKDFKYDESISSVTITVDDCIDLEVPNVITPNGDGKNDVLSIANPLEHPYRLIIYNRWGQQVFDGDNTQVWEGVYKSQALAEGIYFYSLRVWSTLGALKEKSGIIHLFHAE